MIISILKEKEVECPYCYSIYDINNTGLCFTCGSCDSDLEIEIDEEGSPYIANY